MRSAHGVACGGRRATLTKDLLWAPETVDLDALLYTLLRVLFILMVIQIGLSFEEF